MPDYSKLISDHELYLHLTPIDCRGDSILPGEVCGLDTVDTRAYLGRPSGIIWEGEYSFTEGTSIETKEDTNAQLPQVLFSLQLEIQSSALPFHEWLAHNRFDDTKAAFLCWRGQRKTAGELYKAFGWQDYNAFKKQTHNAGE